MIIAHHLIWSAYGTWLPNDLRGSGSEVVISRKLAALGAAHLGRKSVQPRRPDVRSFYSQAVPMLVHPVIRFDATQRATIAAALGDAVRNTPYTCWACTVMPDHVHLIIRKHRHRAEEMIERLQEATRTRLGLAGLVPPDHPVWTVNGWRTFLDSPSAVRACIAYVGRNPEREGLPRQHWDFVTPYDGWPFARRRG